LHREDSVVVELPASRGGTLAGVNVDDMELSGAVLENLNMEGATLCSTKLQGANMRGADLYCATCGRPRAGPVPTEHASGRGRLAHWLLMRMEMSTKDLHVRQAGGEGSRSGLGGRWESYAYFHNDPTNFVAQSGVGHGTSDNAKSMGAIGAGVLRL